MFKIIYLLAYQVLKLSKETILWFFIVINKYNKLRFESVEILKVIKFKSAKDFKFGDGLDSTILGWTILIEFIILICSGS